MLPTEIGSVSRDLLADRVADRLRQAIVSGTLKVNTRLVEVKLAKLLGTSRAPLREALRILEREGLVVRRSGKGTFVTGFTENNIRDTFAVRQVLEAFAAELAASNISPDQLDELESLVSQMEEAVHAGRVDDFLQADFEVHRMIWQASGNTRLVTLLENLVSPIEVFISINADHYTDWLDDVDTHRRLVEAVSSGNGQLAASSVREHTDIDKAVKRALEMIGDSQTRPG